MGTRNITYACVDVTAGNPAMDVAWLHAKEKVIHHERTKNLEATLELIESLDPLCIAIDAPSMRKSKNSSRKAAGRCCELALNSRGIKIYYTAPNKNTTWVNTGLNLYNHMTSKLGYSLLKQKGKVQLIRKKMVVEVYPHASFVVGLGWIPSKKDSFQGKLERIAFLRERVDAHGLAVDERLLPDDALLKNVKTAFRAVSWEKISKGGLALPSLPSDDVLDALAGLMTVYSSANGGGYAIGDMREGVIVLPSKPKEKYYRPKVAA